MGLETYTTAAAVSIAFNDPKRVIKLDPSRKKVIALEDVHPMLRPVRNRSG